MAKFAHVFDFLCDAYTGNFELEFLSYVFNVTDYDHEHRDYSSHLTEEEKLEIATDLGEEFIEGFYSEYGTSYAEVGNGVNPLTGESCFTVRVHVSDDGWNALTPEALERLKLRSAKFFEVYEAKRPSYQAAGGGFLGLTHTITESTTRTETI